MRRGSTRPQQAQLAIGLSLPRGRLEVKKMRRCRWCGAVEEAEFRGSYCGRCEKIAGDVWAELALQFGSERGQV